jgi:molecular chaperone GrpE
VTFAQDGIDEPRPAGPGPDDEGALRARSSSSTPPSSGPPTGEGSPEDPQGGSAAASPDDVEQDIAALLSDTQQERDEFLELAKRTKADFENYRKRMAAEVQAAGARGKGELALELIDAVDNLERALDSAGVDAEGQGPSGDAPEVKSGEALAQGVLLVLRGMRETLRRHGIEALDPKGEKFDPQWHEALSTQPADGVESGVVVDVMQKGYKLGEQLIRPARVVVAE